MLQKKSRNAAWAVSAAFAAIALLLLLFFLTKMPADQEEGILLPDSPEAPQQNISNDANTENTEDPQAFLEITNKNVISAMQSLSRPIAYHQIYTVTVGTDEDHVVHQVSLWIKGSLLHAEISDGSQVRNIISDSSTAYIWYDNDDSVISVTLDDTIRTEDLFGILNFDSHLTLTQDEVVDSAYMTLRDTNFPCIYICAQRDMQNSFRYWINLETGLIYQADVLENSNRVYALQQQLYEPLALEDETFEDRFCLPDGTNPFTAASKMLQP